MRLEEAELETERRTPVESQKLEHTELEGHGMPEKNLASRCASLIPRRRGSASGSAPCSDEAAARGTITQDAGEGTPGVLKPSGSQGKMDARATADAFERKRKAEYVGDEDRDSMVRDGDRGEASKRPAECQGQSSARG